MNKRQRKKRVTKMKRYIERFLRDSLKPFIGAPVTPEAKARMESFMVSALLVSALSPQPMNVITATAVLSPPFHQWRGPETDALIHHVGERRDVLSELGPWHRFCDRVNVDESHVLFQTPVMVNCIRCLAMEARHFNAQADLNKVP